MKHLLLGFILASIFGLITGPEPAQADPPPASPTGTTSDPNRIMPDVGWWWSDTAKTNEASGRGYSIEANLSSGGGFFAAYVYNDNGTANWYYAVLDGTKTSTETISQGFYGPFNITTSMSGTLSQASGGVTLGGAFKQSTGTAVGKITITFDSQTTGTITWPTSVTNRSTRITRYALQYPDSRTILAPAAGTVPQNGWWYNPAESGRGYFIEVQGSRVFIATYMYRADGSAVWYIAGPTAMTTSNSISSTSLSEVANGPTFSAPTVSNGVATPVGTISMTFSDSKNGMVSLNGGTPFAITRFTQY
jgi:hypothetical protein